jgi:predicted DNA-binding protein
MTRKKVSTTIYITADQSKRLKLLSERTERPVAEFIRQGIDLVLERNARLIPVQLDLLESDRDPT